MTAETFTDEVNPDHEGLPRQTIEVPGEPAAQLRRLGEGDADALYEVIAANREHLSRTDVWAQVMDLAGTHKLIDKSVEKMMEGKRLEYLIFAGASAESSDDIQGMARLTSRPPTEPGRMELSYWLAEQAQGKGVVQRSAQALISYGQAHNALTEVMFTILPGNERSIKVAKRLAETHGTELFFGGQINKAAHIFDAYLVRLPEGHHPEESAVA